MRVAFATLVDLQGTSGQNVYSHNVARSLGCQEDVELVLICPEPDGGVLPPGTAELVDEVYFLPPKRSRQWRWHLALQRPMLDAFRAATDERGLDLIVSTLRPSLVVPPLFAKYQSVPYHLLVEGAIGPEVADITTVPGSGKVTNAVAAINFGCSRRVFAVNERVREWVGDVSWGAPPVEVLHHAVETRLYSTGGHDSQSCPSSVESGGIVVGYVGSFKPYHCLRQLVEATATVRQGGHDVRLLLVGDGPQRDEIESLVTDMELGGVTSFPGFVEHEAVGKYISATTVCYGVIDPDRTGSPMKVYEYLACGRPVIATDGPELSFVRRHEAGILVEESTTECVGAALTELATLPEEELQAMGDAGRTSVEKHGLTWDAFGRRLVALQ